MSVATKSARTKRKETVTTKKQTSPQENDKIKVLTPEDIQRFKAEDLVSKSKVLFQHAADSRRKYDWEWLVRDLFRRGYQFSSYNQSAKTVVLSSRSQARVTINLVWSQMRVIRNQVVAFKPKWEVLPRARSEEALSNARLSNKLLDYYYDKLNLKSLIKKTVTQGLTYSVGGPWQIGFDPDANEGKGEVYVWLIDTYDFYVDPSARTLEEAEYCIKAVRKPLEAVRNNPAYFGTGDLSGGEGALAASEYKQFLLQALTYQQAGQIAEEEGVIVKEVYIKTRVNDKNFKDVQAALKEAGQKYDSLRDGETVMQVVTYTDLLQEPLQMKMLRRSDFPFVLYEADVEPVSLYGESWMKHIIPMNRVVNALESSILEFNYKVAKGRIAIQKNSGVRMLSNQHGDVVEYNAGSNPPIPLQMPSLPSSYHTQIESMRRYIEDIGGAHDVSLGRVPEGVKSGVGIAELKSADATNQQDLVDSLSDFLIDVAKKVLREIAENYDIPHVIEALGKSGDPQHFAVIGEDASKSRKNTKQVTIGADTLDLAVIGRESEVRVSIGSWLAYTKSAQQDKLKEYYDSQIIDQQTFLELSEFGDIEGIVERTRKQKLMDALRGAPAQEGMPTDEEIALQENIQMTKEGKLPDALEEDNHEIHLMIHEEAMGSSGNPIVEAHMDQHLELAKRAPKQKAAKMVPADVQSQMGDMSQGEVGGAAAPAMGAIPMPGAAPGAPPMQGGSPEEAMLMQALAEMQGGM